MKLLPIASLFVLSIASAAQDPMHSKDDTAPKCQPPECTIVPPPMPAKPAPMERARPNPQCRSLPYPYEASVKDQSGKVAVRFSISATGEVTAAAITRSSGFKELDSGTIKAATQCGFRPAYMNGHALASSLELEFDWKFDD